MDKIATGRIEKEGYVQDIEIFEIDKSRFLLVRILTVYKDGRIKNSEMIYERK